MQVGFILLIGISAGLVIGWLATASRMRAELSAFRIQAEGSLRAAESTATELRNRLVEMKSDSDAKIKEISSLHEQLKSESDQRASAQAELRETRCALEELSTIRNQLRTESELRVAAETMLSESRANLEEQKNLLAEAEARLSDTFTSLSADALKSNNQAFLALARSTFETIQAQAMGDLDT